MATESDKTSTGVIATIVVVGSFAMIAISAMVTAMVRAESAELEQLRPTNADLDTVAELDRKQLARLNAAPSWVGEPGGKVAIPIATAMRSVVEQYQKDPLAASPPPPPGLVMVTEPSGEAVPGATGAVPGPGALPSMTAPAGAAPSAPSSPTPQSPAAPTPAAPTPVAPTPAAPAPPRATPVAPTPAEANPAAPSPPPVSPAAPTPTAPSATPPIPKPPSPAAPGAVPPSAPPSKAAPAQPTPAGEP